MANIINSFSEFNNHKVSAGINVSQSPTVVSEYILQRQLIRLFEKEITDDTIKERAKQCGISEGRLLYLKEVRVYKIKKVEKLQKALEINKSEGFKECVK